MMGSPVAERRHEETDPLRAVAAAEARFRGLLESAPDGILTVDAAGRITLINARVEAMFGYARDELVGQPVEILIPAPHRERHVRHRAGYAVDPRLRPMGEGLDLAGRRKDGSEFPAEISLSPFASDDGSATIAVIRDVGERRRLAASLRESEERFRGAFDNAPIGMALVAPDGRFLRVNRSLCEIVGYPEADLLARTFQAITHPDDLDADLAQVRRVLAGEIRTYRLEKRYLHRDGRIVFALLAVSLVRDDAGRPRYFVSQISDITERKQAETALQESHGLLQAVIDGVPDHIFLKDLAGRYTTVNNAMARFVERAADRLIGVRDEEIFAPELARAIREHDRHTLAGLAPRTYEEVVSDGPRTGVFLTTKDVYRDAAGEVRGVFGISRDITELKRIEAEIRRLNASLEERVAGRTAELEAANRELEAFAYSVSHDLRAPLRAIDGFARILRDDFAAALPPEAARLLDLLRANAQQMGRLVDDLLAFSRLSRQPLAKRPVAPAAIARGVAADLLAACPARRIDLTIDDLPPCAADPALLRQVFVNLLDNAVKYTRGRDPATIVVSGRLAGDEAVYAVRDNGAGFEMRYAARLFGVFQRLHRGDEFEGTGVGLAIVQRVIHRHGGRVWAEAEVERGATFWFALPASQPPAPPGS
jgi:PAS domain S-box-containing protein